MKNKYKLLIIIVIIITGVILSDWEHFKAGLLGQPPVQEVENTQ